MINKTVSGSEIQDSGQPSDRQLRLLSAAALESIGNMYPDSSAVGQAHLNAAARLWAELGDWTAAEMDDAIAAYAFAPIKESSVNSVMSAQLGQ